MTYDEIRKMPTSIQAEAWRSGELRSASGVHESCLRSYHILAKVKWLLERETHPDVIVELIRVMEEKP